MNRDRSWTIGLCLFLAIATFFLWTEHRAHLFGLLPYLLLLACLFIHLFVHRGHGGHGQADGTHEGRGAHRHGGTS